MAFTATATLMGLLSALATCLLVLCIGPTLKVFLSYSPGNELNFSEHLSPIQTQVLGWFFNPNSLSSNLLYSLPFIILSLSFIKSLTTYLGKSMWGFFAESKSHQVRKKIVKNYLEFDQNSSPEKYENIDKNLAALIGTDTMILKEYITRFFGDLPKELITSILLMCLAVYLSPYLSGILFFLVLPIAVITGKISKKIKRRSKAELDLYSHLSEWAQERFYGIETIKQFKTEDLEIEKLEALSKDLKTKYSKTASTKARTAPVSEGLTAIAIACIIYIIFKTLYTENQSGNTYLTFFAALTFLSQSLKSLTQYFNFYNEAIYAKERLQTALNLYSKKSDLFQLNYKDAEHQIVLSNIDYRYDNQADFSIEGFSYTFLTDKIYVICGYSGSGKSSIMRLITGLSKAQSGNVKLKLDQRTPSPDIVFVPQAVNLLPGSVAENIHYPSKNALDSQKIKSSIQKSCLDPDYLEGLDDIQEDGSHSLSGGESQRVLLSRIFYHEPKLILIDEGTSALDEEMESKILHEINQLKKNRITIIIAHRQSAFQYADSILYIENGKLECEGNLEECLKNKNFSKFYKN